MSEGSDIITRTVQKVRRDGKWMEFWFEESEEAGDLERNYDLSEKAARFWHQVEMNDMQEEILNSGVVGRVIEWEKRGMNYTIIDIST